MTGVAAALVVAILIRPESQITGVKSEQGAVSPSKSVVEGQTAQPTPEREEAVGSRLATGNLLRAWQISDPDKMSYLNLRNQVLLHGIESWKFPSSSSIGPDTAIEEPLTYREQLERLLRETNHAG
jgi:hypothetical protein